MVVPFYVQVCFGFGEKVFTRRPNGVAGLTPMGRRGVCCRLMHFSFFFFWDRSDFTKWVQHASLVLILGNRGRFMLSSIVHSFIHSVHNIQNATDAYTLPVGKPWTERRWNHEQWTRPVSNRRISSLLKWNANNEICAIVSVSHSNTTNRCCCIGLCRLIWHWLFACYTLSNMATSTLY